MSNSVKGKMIKMLDQESGQGARGEWIKQPFIIETSDQYPKKICFEAWGSKAAQIEHIKPGQEIEVFYNLESREYNERWYTTASVWKIKGSGQEAVATNSTSSDSEDDLPF